MHSAKNEQPSSLAGRCTNVQAFLGLSAGVFAIEILAQCPGGGWRTLKEWKTMFAAHSYELVDLKQVGASMHLMVWEKQ